MVAAAGANVLTVLSVVVEAVVIGVVAVVNGEICEIK